MPKIVLVRHCQTVQNRLGLIQGRMDTDLSPEGETEAERLARELGEVDFDTVYSSPLKRALKTAQVIVNGRNLSIRPDHRLVEIDQGKWTRRKSVELFKASQRYRLWVKNPTLTHPPDGETIHQVAGRAKAFLGDIEGENVLVVAHGGLIAVMRTIVEALPLDKAWERLPRNGQVIELSLRGESPRK